MQLGLNKRLNINTESVETFFFFFYVSVMKELPANGKDSDK